MKVAVVGAGVSGLQTGRALHKRGYTCTIFEARGAVSGLWTQCTHGQGAQGRFWLLHCIMQAMEPRKECYKLKGQAALLAVLETLSSLETQRTCLQCPEPI